MSGASAGFCGRGAIRGKARGPAVGAKRRLPEPGKTKVTSAGGSRLSPRSGRQTRPGGVEGAPAGRTGAGVNRPTVQPRNAAPAGDCNRKGGRGNTEAAAVHKAGEERRLGATPAIATLLPSSWKARDPGASKRSEVSPGNGTSWEEKSRRAEAVTAKRVSADGLTWFFVAVVIIKRTRPETTRHLFAG